LNPNQYKFLSSYNLGFADYFKKNAIVVPNCWTVIDDFLQFHWVLGLKQKRNMSMTLGVLVSHIDRPLSKMMQQIWSDNCGEYISSDFKHYFLM
jgi:hypothetical protein